MKFALLTVATMIALAGCNKNTYESSGKYLLPDELSDCKIYVLQADGIGETLNVVRCPNSQTAVNYQSGKITTNTVVIDGETYQKVNYEVN